MKRRTILTLLPLWLIGIVAVVLIYRSGSGDAKYETISVSRTDLTQEVSVTGTVKPAAEVSLAFETSGKIARVYKQIGDTAAAGEVIVSLANADLRADASQAQARVSSARAGVLDAQAALEKEQARFEEVKKGSRPEEIKLAQTKADNALQAARDAETNLANVRIRGQIDLDNLYSDVNYLIADAYSSALTAVNQQTDALFDDDLTNSPQLVFLTSSFFLDSAVENGRVQARDALADLSALSSHGSQEQGQLDANLALTEQKLNIIKNFLLDLERAVNLIIGAAEANKDAYRTDVDAALTGVSTSLQKVSAKQQALSAQKSLNANNLAAGQANLNSAQGAYASAVSELELKKAGSTSEQIALSAAQVKQAQANLASAQARVQEMEAALLSAGDRLGKTLLRAPFSGVVTKLEAKVGEIAGGFTRLVSLISTNLFEIEVNVPEADIAKIGLGNEVRINFDAYGEDVLFAGKVISIDPAADIVQGVATYRVIIGFNKEDERIKSGLTANIDIITGRRNNALAIPQRAIINKENKKFVRLLRGQEVEEVEVRTGLSDGKGNVEILEGLEEGDRVVINYLISE